MLSSSNTVLFSSNSDPSTFLSYFNSTSYLISLTLLQSHPNTIIFLSECSTLYITWSSVVGTSRANRLFDCYGSISFVNFSLTSETFPSPSLVSGSYSTKISLDSSVFNHLSLPGKQNLLSTGSVSIQMCRGNTFKNVTRLPFTYADSSMRSDSDHCYQQILC